MLLFIAIATIGFAVYYLAEVATSPKRTRRNLVHRAANYGRAKVGGKELPKFRERVFAPLTTQVARLGFLVNAKTSTAAAANKLMASSNREQSPEDFIVPTG